MKYNFTFIYSVFTNVLIYFYSVSILKGFTNIEIIYVFCDYLFSQWYKGMCFNVNVSKKCLHLNRNKEFLILMNLKSWRNDFVVKVST